MGPIYGQLDRGYCRLVQFLCRQSMRSGWMNLCETFGRIQGVGSSWPRVIRMYNLTWVPTTYHRPASTLSSPIIWKCLLYTARGVSSWIWVNTFNVFTLYTHPTFSYLSLITCLLHHVLNAWLCWGHKSKDDNSTNKYFECAFIYKTCIFAFHEWASPYCVSVYSMIANANGKCSTATPIQS